MRKLSLASISLVLSVLAVMVAALFGMRVPPLGLVGAFLAVGIAVGLALVLAHGPDAGSSR